MMIKTATKFLMTAAVISVLFVSCKKDKDDDDKETSTARDNALAENSFSDVVSIADQAATGMLSTYLAPNSPDTKSMLSSCATITHDTISVPRLLTINFGASNCLCNDGRYRRGIINVSYTGRYRDSASTHTITFNNYYVENNKISGTKTVVNNGYNAAGNLSYSVTVNGQIDKALGGVITWTSSRTREWIEGDSTMTWGDDVYLITGSASGVSTPVSGAGSSTSYSITITSPLRKEIGCRHMVSGKFDLVPSGKATRSVDFGTGACDNTAQVTINGHIYTVTLN